MSTLNRPVKPDNYNISGTDSIPASVALTGTYSTNNADAFAGKLVTGTGTLFTTQIRDIKLTNPRLRYRYLLDPATVTVREIAYVLNDTSLMLKQAFPVSVTANPPVACPNPDINYKEISVLVPSTGATVNGSTVQNGSVLNYTRNPEGLRPIAVQAGTTPLQIQTEQ